MSTISRIATRRERVPLPRPWGPDVPDLGFVHVVVEDADGNRGRGVSWTPTIGAAAVQALLVEDIVPRALGRTTDPEQLWPELWAALHEAGGGGITTIALAGLDLALWDLRGRLEQAPVAELAGVVDPAAEVYGSGVNLHYPLDELRAQAERWVARGFHAVKVKVGKPDVAEDLDRLTAVREIIGPDRRLMIDANQRWDLPTAIRHLDVLQQVGPAWIEEPLRADDLLAHRALRGETGIPIALGENLHTRYRFAEFLDAGVVDVIQPNIVRVGGITPFRQIAADAAGRADVAPHLLIDLSGQLAAALPGRTLVEDVEEADFASLGLLGEPSPVRVDRDRLEITRRPGLGLDFTTPVDWTGDTR